MNTLYKPLSAKSIHVSETSTTTKKCCAVCKRVCEYVCVCVCVLEKSVAWYANFYWMRCYLYNRPLMTEQLIASIEQHQGS